jgi:hypothetical protein
MLTVEREGVKYDKKSKGGDKNGKASDASFSCLRARFWPEGA